MAGIHSEVKRLTSLIIAGNCARVVYAIFRSIVEGSIYESDDGLVQTTDSATDTAYSPFLISEKKAHPLCFTRGKQNSQDEWKSSTMLTSISRLNSNPLGRNLFPNSLQKLCEKNMYWVNDLIGGSSPV